MYCIVNEFDLQHKFAEDILARTPNLIEENSGMNGCKKRSIKPATTLRYELGNLRENVGTNYVKGNIHTVVGTSVEALAVLTYLSLYTIVF